MPEPLAVIGKRIKERRQQLRLTVEELARRCRMSKGQLSKIENARTLPWLPMLVEIARQIELPLE
ncbi:MAG: helix-turn-helix transcriptional regulator, partial [Planctomycetota bacterium]